MSCVEDSLPGTVELPQPASAPRGQEASDALRKPTRWLSAWILLVAAMSFAALAAPALMGRVYVRDDLGEFHLPLRNFYAQQLARGEPFDWMPSLYGGFYVSGEGQLGGYHPWHWFLYRLLPLPAAFDVELLSSYPLLFAGTYLFLRRLANRGDAALFGALAFTFGGFSLLHFVHPNAIAVVAHLPWLLWAIDVLLSTDRPWHRAAAVFAIGLLTASQLLLGYPQYVWFSLLAGGALVAWRVAARRTSLVQVAAVLIALSLGVAAGAAQWLPTFEFLAHSTRQTPDAAFAATGSLHLLNLTQLIAPYLFATRVAGQNTHELGLYIGAVPVVLWFWLVAHRRQWGRYRPLVRAIIVFAGFALLLAAGEFGGLYRLQSIVPLANRFRFPCRAIVLFQLATVAGSAVALALLLERRTAPDQAPRDRALWAALLLSIALAVAGPIVWPSFVASRVLVWTGPLLVGLAAILVAMLERHVRGSAMLLVLFTAIDLTFYGLSYSVIGGTALLDAYAGAANIPPGTRHARVAAPYQPGENRVGNRMLLAGVARVDGYAGLEPARSLDYREAYAWRRAGAEWVLAPRETGQSAKRAWQPLTQAAPRARLVSKTLGPEHLPHVASLGLDTVVAQPHLAVPASPPGTARVLADRPGQIVVHTQGPAPQLLVTTESFDPGWTVTIDGRPVPAVRVDGDFLGCRVAAGTHRVLLDFRPQGRRLGAIISTCGLGLMVLAACAFALSGRRSA